MTVIDDMESRADYDLCNLLSQAGLTTNETLTYLMALARCIAFRIEQEVVK